MVATPSRRGKARAAAIGLGMLLPAALAAFLLHRLWTQARGEALTAHRFRALAAMGAQVADTVDAVRTAVETKTRSEAVADRGSGAAGAQTGPPPAAGRGVALVWSADEGSTLRMECPEPSGGRRECGRIPFADLLGPLSRDAFDVVLLADATDGRVLRQHGLAEGPITTLAELPTVEPGAPWTPRADAGKPASSGASPAATPLGGIHLPLSPTRVEHVRLLDRAYLLYCEPVAGRNGTITAARAPTDAAAHAPTDTAQAAARADVRFALCGLVQESRVAAERDEIPWQLAFLLLVALVLGALAMPVLKLRYLGPRERLRAVDVKVLVLACVLGTGFMTLAVDALRDYASLRAGLDARLGLLARELRGALAGEIARASGALRGFVTAAVGERGALARDDRLALDADASTVLDLLLVDETGASVAHFVPAARAGRGTEPVSDVVRAPWVEVNVGDRSYFWRARAGKGWHPGSDVAMEAVWTRLHGDLALALAVRRHDHVGVLSTAILPLRHAATSPLLALALVDRQGTVQVHSQWRKSGQENLIVETDGDARLRSALWDGLPGILPLRYRGRAHRAWVVPLHAAAPGARASPGDFSVVALLDDRLAQIAGAETIAVASFSSLVFALIGILAAVVVQMLRDDYRAPWIWPDRHAVGASGYWGAATLLLATAAVANDGFRHATLAVSRDGSGMSARLLAALVLAVPTGTLAGLGLLLARGARVSTAERVVLSTLVVASAAVVLGAGIAGRDPLSIASFAALGGAWLLAGWAARRGREPALAWSVWPILGALALGHALHGSRLSALALALATLAWWPGRPLVAAIGRPGGRGETAMRAAYASMLLALLLVVAAVPAHAIWRDARTHVAIALARYDVGRVDSAVEDRRWEIDSDGVRSGGDGDRGPRLPEPQVREFRLWQPAAGAGGGRARLASASGLLSASASGHLPDYSALAVDLRAAAAGGGPDTAWWAPAPDVESRLVIDGCTAAAAALALVVGLGLLWSIARAVFLLEVDAPASAVDTAPAGADGRTTWTFSRPPDAIRFAAAAGARLARFDLREPTSPRELQRRLRRHVDGGEVVELDHLDARLADEDGGDAVLGILERLVAEPGASVVVTAAQDPVEHLSARREHGESGHASDPAADGRWRRWVQVLAAFSERPVVADWDGGGGACPDDAAIATHVARAYADAGLPAGANATDADARHWRVWLECTVAERLALRQLAEEGFLNPRNDRAVRSLLRRGLVRRDGPFELATPSFREFVRRAVPADTVTGWEREGEPSGWSRLRIPLSLAVVLGAIVIVSTYPELCTSLVGMLGAVTAAVPILLRLFGMLGEERSGTAGG